MWVYGNINKLTHSGIKGMKWGVRRYQNKDGSLTPAGKKRYPISEDSKKVSEIRKKRVREMSNQELKDANNRLQLERQYKDLTKKQGVGKKAVKAFIATAGTLSAVTAAAATYKKLGGQALDAIGDWVVKDIKF